MSILLKLETKAVDLFSRRLFLRMHDFILVREYKGVPVYAPANKECREKLFCDEYAYALGEGIFVKYKSYAKDIALLEHEHEHVKQLREWGVLFSVLYILQEKTVGYRNNRFEKEARLAERRIRSKRRN